jgi:PhnB protein
MEETMAVRAIPEGFHSITPYLIIKNASQGIEFYKQAFGAQETFRMEDPSSKKVGHAELKIGDSFIMLADEHPDMGYRSPEALGGTPVSILLYVENVDAVVEQAVRAGAKLERPVRDEFYGDRTGTLRDPYGHVWSVATHKEDVSPEEMKRRAAAAFQTA